MIKPRLLTATRCQMRHAHWNRWSALCFVLLFALVPLVSAPVDAAPMAAMVTGTASVEKLESEYTGSQVTPERRGGTVTLLMDGRVLISGGGIDNTAIASAELYDPTTGTFTATGNMQTARYWHEATLLSDGRVLITGGFNPDDYNPDDYGSGVLYGAELYDPDTGTFTSGGSLEFRRYGHTATLLADGTVLIAGGHSRNFCCRILVAAELYDPMTGTFTRTAGNMQKARSGHTATLLADGKVLIAGATNDASGELYDPATRRFTLTGNLRLSRSGHTATLLADGNVLIVSGGRAELYDPTTGTFTVSGSMEQGRNGHTATMLNDGRVLIVGGSSTLTEIYDPATGKFTDIGDVQEARSNHTAMLLGDGKVLLFGGTRETTQAELVSLSGDTNIFTGTLTLPDGWSPTATPSITFRGSTTDAPLTDGALNDGPWIVVQSNVSMTTTLPSTSDGVDRPVRLRLRDVDGRVAGVVVGYVDIDTGAPTSQVRALPTTSPGTFKLQWTGSDALSGIASYDVEVRDGRDGTWKPLVSGTTALRATFNGVQGQTLFFRVRARDVAGNIEAWPETFDAKTQVDTLPPLGSLRINNGSASTTSPTVFLTLNARDRQSPVTKMRIAQVGTSAEWISYASVHMLKLVGADGVKQVSVEFQDSVGNITQPITQKITMDTAAGMRASLLINNGAAWTNTPAVTLRIGALAGTTEMQISNDDAFADAFWLPFNSRPQWKLSTDGEDATARTVYVRTRDRTGRISSIVSDNITYDSQRQTYKVGLPLVRR